MQVNLDQFQSQMIYFVIKKAVMLNHNARNFDSLVTRISITKWPYLGLKTEINVVLCDLRLQVCLWIREIYKHLVTVNFAHVMF